MEPLTVDFDIQESDLVRAQFWGFQKNWDVRLAYAGTTLGALVVLPLTLGKGPRVGEREGLVFLALLIFLFVVVPAAVFWSGRSIYRNLRPEGRTIKFKFTENQVEIRNGLGTLVADEVHRVRRRQAQPHSPLKRPHGRFAS